MGHDAVSAFRTGPSRFRRDIGLYVVLRCAPTWDKDDQRRVVRPERQRNLNSTVDAALQLASCIQRKRRQTSGMLVGYSLDEEVLDRMGLGSRVE